MTRKPKPRLEWTLHSWRESWASTDWAAECWLRRARKLREGKSP